MCCVGCLLFLSDVGPTLETLDFTICIGSTREPFYISISFYVMFADCSLKRFIMIGMFYIWSIFPGCCWNSLLLFYCLFISLQDTWFRLKYKTYLVRSPNSIGQWLQTVCFNVVLSSRPLGTLSSNSCYIFGCTKVDLKRLRMHCTRVHSQNWFFKTAI